jgi:arylsulfatase A-like enzyme
MNGQQAVRDGDLKYVRVSPTEKGLFNVRTDISETTDLSAQQPETVRRLAALWQEFEARILARRAPPPTRKAAPSR